MSFSIAFRRMPAFNWKPRGYGRVIQRPSPNRLFVGVIWLGASFIFRAERFED
ncbi:hypothetical protein [Azospirillum argentinense]|uniref:hypothetical protein n=1 Tax=Azospirillum argentinense TaxID=2970906 RepID=UPI0032DF07C3